MIDKQAAVISAHQTRKSVEVLLGLITGIVADDQLHDMEIKLLATWLAEHAEAARTWPGSLVSRKVTEIMADGRITDAERSHLLDVLKELALNDFAITGSASPEVLSLPIDCKSASRRA